MSLKPQQYEITLYNLLKTLYRMDIKGSWMFMRNGSRSGIMVNDLSRYVYKYGRR